MAARSALVRTWAPSKLMLAWVLPAALGGIVTLNGDDGAIHFAHAGATLKATCNTGASPACVGMSPSTVTFSDLTTGTLSVVFQLSDVAPTCSESTQAPRRDCAASCMLSS